jgi:hypothetical protein
MKVPKTVQIGPLLWRITTSLADYQAFALSENDKALGFCRLEDLTIVIKPSIPTVLKQETLLHEVLHAIVATQGGVVPTAKGSELEEAFVSATSPMLLLVLRDNPDLVAFLLSA